MASVLEGIPGLNPRPIFDQVEQWLTPPSWNKHREKIPLLDLAIAKAHGKLIEPAAGLPPKPKVGLTRADFQAAAAMLPGVEDYQIRAFWEVEATGSGWFTDIRADILMLDGPGGFIDGDVLLKILFEAHWFSRFTDGKYNKSHPNISSPRWNRALYVGGQVEWRRLWTAMQLDREAALKSASYGGPQIMGFNHKKAGFATVQGMVDAMAESEFNHLLAFVNFIKNTPGLLAALAKTSTVHADNRDAARLYNGDGYFANQYHIKIARAIQKWRAAWD